MKILETERLILRKFKEDDHAAVHSYASNPENTIFMIWSANTEAQTQAFIQMAITEARKEPCKDHHYAVVLKSTDKLIGGCSLTISGNEAEIGWIIHIDHWNKGYGTELASVLLKFAFDDLYLHRIIAHCDADNHASYRVMEKIGMRREGVFLEARPPHKLSNKNYGDELSYAILRDEWKNNCIKQC